MSAAVLTGFAIAIPVFEMDAQRAVTVSFLILAVAELGDVCSVISPRSGFVFNEVTRNPWRWGAIILCTGLLIAPVYVPIPLDVSRTVEPGREGWMRGQSLRAIVQIRRKYGPRA